MLLDTNLETDRQTDRQTMRETRDAGFINGKEESRVLTFRFSDTEVRAWVTCNYSSFLHADVDTNVSLSSEQ